MKKYFILLFIATTFLVSCNNAELEKLKSQNDSLMSVTNTDEIQIQDFLKGFNEIQENLNSIKDKEEIITVKTSDGELDANAKDQINEDILTIYELMLENKETIQTLKTKLASASYKNTELQKTIDLFTASITEKDKEITILKDQLATLNIDIENLNSQIADLNSNVDTLKEISENQSNVIDEQDVKLHTVYYVYGTKTELKEHNILSKEGAFKPLKIDDNFDKTYFTKIDDREVLKINLNAKTATILSTHPASSYKFIEKDKKVQSIEITDYATFWEKSKFLVIVVD
jgi:hypothetical protein